MVQLKYFGDSRDFFKYDLIRTLLGSKVLSHYVFIPMLTKHRDDNEGRKLPRGRGEKSRDLLTFISQCNSKSLTHWKRFLECYVESYRTLEPVDQTFFADKNRDNYWESCQQIIVQNNALIFVDPDTGLETGKPSYLNKMGREKYILNYELQFLISKLCTSSILMLYQHLLNNKHKHIESVQKKIAQVHSVNKSAFVCAYREDDLAFLFISKEKKLHEQICKLLEQYHTDSNHKYKSIHT